MGDTDVRCGSCGWAKPSAHPGKFMRCYWDAPLPYSAYEFCTHLVARGDGESCPCWKPKED